MPSEGIIFGESGEKGGDGEMGRWGDGEMGRWGDGEMGRWGDGEMGRWGDGEMQNPFCTLRVQKFERQSPSMHRTNIRRDERTKPVPPSSRPPLTPSSFPPPLPVRPYSSHLSSTLPQV